MNCSLIVKAVVAFLVAAILFDVAISITNMKIIVCEEEDNSIVFISYTLK